MSFYDHIPDKMLIILQTDLPISTARTPRDTRGGPDSARSSGMGSGRSDKDKKLYMMYEDSETEETESEWEKEKRKQQVTHTLY